uniref:Phosphoglycerate mutase n=1 Tax=Lotharella globosa TaxID=91324 RepID=A0A7S4DM54_9EUKA
MASRAPRRCGGVIGALGMAAILLAGLRDGGTRLRRRWGDDSYYSSCEDSPSDDMTIYPAHMRRIPEELLDGDYKYQFEPPGPPPESPEIDEFPDVTQMLPPLAEGSSRVYLCRHAETDHNAQGLINGWHDTWLNAKGSEQAEALGLFLRNAPLDRICSSTAIRAYITADRVACWHAKCRRFFLDDLSEMNFGILEGMALHNASIRQFYNELKQHWAKGNVKQRIPKGESANPPPTLPSTCTL